MAGNRAAPRTPEGQQVVNVEAEVHRVHAPAGIVIDRDHQRQRPDEVRGIAQQVLALLQRFVHEAKFTELEVAEPAVDEAAGPAGGAVAEVALLDEAGVQTAECGVAGDPRTVDAAPDDDQVELHGRSCRGGFSRDRRWRRSGRA